MILAAIKARLELMTVNDMRVLQEEEKKTKTFFFSYSPSLFKYSIVEK